MTDAELAVCDRIVGIAFAALADGVDPMAVIDSLRGCAAGIAELVEARKMENSTKKTRH